VIFQLLALGSGIVGLILFYASVPLALAVVAVSLLLFVAIDVFGLLSGRLMFGPGVLLPLLPAIFVRPWPVGLLWGYLVFSGIDFIVSASRARAQAQWR